MVEDEALRTKTNGRRLGRDASRTKKPLTFASTMLSTISVVLLAGFRTLEVKGVTIQHEDKQTSRSKPNIARRLVPSHIHEKLSKAILEDVLPPISSTCGAVREPDSYTTSFNFTFSSSHPTSQWDLDAVDVEEHAFLVEMTHNDTSLDKTDQAWRMRLGRGGNVYSFVGAYGEAIPPQKRGDSPWVDEVWQSVAVNQDLNSQEEGTPYFIHQAGTYDGPEHDDLKIPFYSPTIAVYCAEHSCSVASWGQHAHVPTKFESSLVYINRYTNCNNGVVEIMSLIHNFGDHEDPNDRMMSHDVNFLNIPWGGVRTSTLPDLLLSTPPSKKTLRANDRNTNLKTINPIPLFGADGASLPNVDQSGGSTVFAQEHYHHEDEDYNSTKFDLPCGVERNRVIRDGWAVPCHHDSASPLKLVLKRDDACRESTPHTSNYGVRVILCSLEQTVEIEDSCLECSLKLINQQTGANFLINGVIHWAFVKERFYFMVDDEVTVDLVNNVFQGGDTIHVERYERGVHHDDALSLAFVHGRDIKDEFGEKHSQIMSSFIRWGRSGVFKRDFVVFVVIIRALVKANQTYIKRHYVVTDRLHAMQENRLSLLSDDTYQTVKEADDYDTGRTITLFGTSDFKWFNVALDTEERDECSSVSSNDVVEICQGWTTPGEGSTKLLYMRCGDEYHVGEDFYHFTEEEKDEDFVRPYVCNDSEDDKPEVMWLGFFPRGACDQLTDAKMNVNLCDATPPEVETMESEVEVTASEVESAESVAPPDSFYPAEVVQTAINTYLEPPMGGVDEAQMGGVDTNPFSMCNGGREMGNEPCMSLDRNRVRQPGQSFNKMIGPANDIDESSIFESSASTARTLYHTRTSLLFIVFAIGGLSTTIIADYF